ncbi:MAG: glycosyltransferase family 2 protein [Bryobacteraceae bacterium]
MSLAVDVAVALAALFSLRRLLWVLASWLPQRHCQETGKSPASLIAVAFRNERTLLPRLLASLDALRYDRERVEICLVDDASTDGGRQLVEQWAVGRNHVRLLVLQENVGKAEALNRALRAAAPCEVVVVYDADQAPAPDSLERLVGPFSDPRIEAVCGYRRPVIAKLTPVAAYASLEAWTYQLVNLAAKDALGLDPPTMGGNCAYRRTALDRIGGFPPGAFSEDIEASLQLSASGGKTRFAMHAVADHVVADSFEHYVNQRLRWSRGLMASARHVRGLEAAFVAAGYLDRAVLLVLLACVIAGHASALWLAVYAVPAVAAVATALAKARPGFRLVAMLLTTLPLMVAADVAVSVFAMVHPLIGGKPRWLSPPIALEQRNDS